VEILISNFVRKLLFKVCLIYALSQSESQYSFQKLILTLTFTLTEALT